MAQAKDNTSAQLVPSAPGASLPLIALTAGAPLTVGRSDEADVTLPDSSLSRRHATVWHQDGEWWVRDEGSLNGTWVNGERTEGVQLLDGDVVDFGGNAAYRFVVREKAAEKHDRTAYRSPAFCLALQPEDGGKRFLLRRKLSIVGRNRTADLQLDDPSVSGVHAKIEYARGRVVVHDSGSKNGTVVNGEPVRRLGLVPGDRVAFGGVHFTVQRTWLPSAMALSGAVGGVLVALAILLVPLLVNTSSSQAEPLWTRDMYLAQVSESLRLAIEACDEEPRRTDVAEAQFAIAKRSLIGADEMRPDRQTDDDLARALRKAADHDRMQRLLHGRDIWEVYRSLSEAPPEPEPAAEPARRQAPAEAFDLDRELSRMVAQFGIDTRQRPIPPQMRDEVERYIEFWTVEKRSFTERAYRRGAPHLDMIRAELREAQLPEVFCYLPFIESGYQADVTSSAQARGLWQFMPATGRAHGLRIDDEVDERIDPRKATKAACSYINSLLNMFGPNAFLCAVAAYNKGENGMARCLKKNANWRSAWKFWDVASAGDGCLKQETIEYVPRFLAAAVVLRRPEVFGLTTD